MAYNAAASYWSQFSRRSANSYLESARPKAIERLLEAHDSATQKMIEQWEELYRMSGSDTIVPLIERWQWLDKMGSREEKQRLLEDLIQRIQREPDRHGDEAVFVMLVLEPIRRKIMSRLMAGMRLGNTAGPDADRHRRAEAQMLRQIEFNELRDDTRMAALEIIYRYSFNVGDGAFFSWYRETLAWRVTDIYQTKYLQQEDRLSSIEREAINAFLHGFDELEPPQLRDRDRVSFGIWRVGLGGLAAFYTRVDRYADSPQVRRVCRAAIGRLAPRQAEAIQAYDYEGLSLAEIAQRRGRTVSTIGTTKVTAEENLRADDLFYCALDGLGRIRDDARRREIAGRYPDGVLPDGKRIVWIGAEGA